MSVLSRLRSAAAPLLLSSSCRAYGSSAAALLDYDSCDEVDEQSPQQKPAAAESEVWRGVQWVIIGDPIARRHVYADRLAKLLDVPHISMGTLVRQELHPHSSVYKQIASAVNQGKLVPEDVIFGLLSKRLEEGYCRGETGFILDGIPRTRIQAEILDKVADIDLVINLKCMEDGFVKKTPGNGIGSSRDYHSIAGSGFRLNVPSDAHLTSCIPDANTLWKEKLRMCTEQRKPLEEYYKRQKKLLDFQVAGTPGDTWQDLLAALHLKHMNAVNFIGNSSNLSQKLTA